MNSLDASFELHMRLEATYELSCTPVSFFFRVLVKNYAKKNCLTFWSAWSAVTKQLQICFFVLVAQILRILGHVVYHGKGRENIFSTVYYTPQKKFKLQSNINK